MGNRRLEDERFEVLDQSIGNACQIQWIRFRSLAGGNGMPMTAHSK
jgi:hypothetical protein